EIHGLQRKVVLQKASMPALSQEASSRRAAADATYDGQAPVRSTSFNQPAQRLDKVDEEPTARQREKLRRTVSVPAPQPRKRDPKPGYCENCQDKFADFDEVSSSSILPYSALLFTLADRVPSTLCPGSIASLPRTTTIGHNLTPSWHSSSGSPGIKA